MFNFYHYFSAVLYACVILSGCTNKKEFSSHDNKPPHDCDEHLAEYSAIEYSKKEIHSRLGLDFFDEYAEINTELNCKILSYDSKFGEKIFDMFNFFTPETYLLYSCHKRDFYEEVFALPNYVVGEYDIRSIPSANFCMFDDTPLGRETYKMEFYVYENEESKFIKLETY